jgi:hypothetical protein
LPFAPEIGYLGFGAGSENWAPGDPPSTLASGTDTPSGISNVQGRWINGRTTNTCNFNVANAPAPERFIHLEQQRPIHRPPDDQLIDGIDHTLVVGEIGNLFPISPTAMSVV